MRGSGLADPNVIRVSERIPVSVLDSGRVGLTEHRSCAGIEGSPTSPTGFSVVPSTPVGVNPQTVLADSVALHPVLQHLSSSLWTARNLGARGVQPLGTSPTHPHIQQESAICADTGGRGRVRSGDRVVDIGREGQRRWSKVPGLPGRRRRLPAVHRLYQTRLQSVAIWPPLSWSLRINSLSSVGGL